MEKEAEKKIENERLDRLLDDIGALFTSEELKVDRLEALVTAARFGIAPDEINECEADLLMRLFKLTPHQLRNVEIEYLVDDTQVVRVAPIGILTRKGYR
jgi:hypothetical protein